MLPNPILSFSIGSLPLNVHMYGVMIAVGMLCCFCVLWGYSALKKVSGELVDFVYFDGIAAIAVGFGGAMLVQAILNYIKHPEAGFNLGEGMSFLPGLILGAVAFFGIYLLRRKHLTGRMVDIAPMLPCCVLIAHGFGRIGCFFAGCCYGKVTDSWIGVVFPDIAPAGAARIPTQLIEAGFLFLMFGVLSFLYLKYNFRHTVAVYFASYGVFRFIIEFFRDDDRGAFIGPFSPSQVWSVGLVAAGVVAYFFMKKLYAIRDAELAAAEENGAAEENEAPEA